MHLSWILLLTAVCVPCGGTVPSTQWQFSQLITCTQPKVNPSIYNNYGCYCGVSGSGSPKDQIDQCCAVHDKCYENARNLPECSPYAYQPFIKAYFFSCSAKTITCSVLNDKCQAAVCQCDRVAANCFAQYQNSYNSNYINLPTTACNIGDVPEDIIFN